MRWITTLCLGVLILGARVAQSTTVAPLSFDEIVSKAETIFVGEVVERRSVWNDRRDGRRIQTIVTFDVAQVLKGHVGLRTELTFLGGTVDGASLEVTGMPRFQVGDRDVLFVSPEQGAISPLVGFWHGRFRLVRDQATGAEWVRAHDGTPVVAGLDFGKASASVAPRRGPMALPEFESLVRARMESRRQR